jgi:hypothetical protein
MERRRERLAWCFTCSVGPCATAAARTLQRERDERLAEAADGAQGTWAGPATEPIFLDNVVQQETGRVQSFLLQKESTQR